MELTFDLTPYVHWTAIVVIGALLVTVDRRWIGWPLLGGLLVAGVFTGFIITRVSPFSFGGGGHYMEGVLIFSGSALALAGYAFAAILGFAHRRWGGRRDP